MNYRTFRIERSPYGSWEVFDPTKSVAPPYECLGLFEAQREAKAFVDELMAAAARGIADGMRAHRRRVLGES